MPVKSIKSKEGIIDIDLNTAQSAGGKTGSVRVQDKDGNYYQYKPPITDNSLKRRAKAGFADNENFGEVLAARIAKAFDNDADNPRVPAVSFVTEQGNSSVAIASKYLKGGQGATVQSLDDYLGKPPEKSHVKLISGEDDTQKGHHNIDADPLLKRELARAIALSSLVGDHDVNPGNMIVIQEKDGSKRLGRIDYGHAFKDLMRFSHLGGKTVHDNNIIDFLNRGTVDGMGSKSKLWRDYPGLMPSKELADALKAVANDEGASERVTTAIHEVRDEVKQLVANPDIDKAHVIRSFQRMSEHVSGEKIDPKLNDDEKIDVIFKQLEDYTHKNQRQMAYAAKVMDLQVDIKQAIKKGQNPESLRVRYDALVKEGEEKSLGPFVWIKEAEKSSPFKGDFNEFVQHQQRVEKLNLLVAEVDDFLKTNPVKHEAALARDLKAVMINPKKSTEDKVILLEKRVHKLDDDPQPKSFLFVRIINSIRNAIAHPESIKNKQHAVEVKQDNTVEQFKDFKTRLQKNLVAEPKPKPDVSENQQHTSGLGSP